MNRFLIILLCALSSTARSKNITNYYEQLGLDPKLGPTYTEQQLKKAFRKKSSEIHPDKLRLKLGREPTAGETKTATEEFQNLGQAMDTLDNPEKRKNYDQFGADDSHNRSSEWQPFGGQTGKDMADSIKREMGMNYEEIFADAMRSPEKFWKFVENLEGGVYNNYYGDHDFRSEFKSQMTKEKFFALLDTEYKARNKKYRYLVADYEPFTDLFHTRLFRYRSTLMRSMASLDFDELVMEYLRKNFQSHFLDHDPPQTEIDEFLYRLEEDVPRDTEEWVHDKINSWRNAACKKIHERLGKANE